MWDSRVPVELTRLAQESKLTPHIDHQVYTALAKLSSKWRTVDMAQRLTWKFAPVFAFVNTLDLDCLLLGRMSPRAGPWIEMCYDIDAENIQLAVPKNSAPAGFGIR